MAGLHARARARRRGEATVQCNPEASGSPPLKIAAGRNKNKPATSAVKEEEPAVAAAAVGLQLIRFDDVQMKARLAFQQRRRQLLALQ